LSAFLARVEERRAGAERDDLHRELARLLRMMATAQDRQGRAPRGPRDDPRRALADAARIVPEPRRAWYELAPGPARRPDAPTDAR
jgi:hypothetical protein